MPKVIVKNLLGIGAEGEEFEVVAPPYTKREWHEIKKQTGLRPGEFEEAYDQKDPDLILAFAAVTLVRAGYDSRIVWNTLWDTDDDDARIQFIADEADEAEAEGDAGPPALAAVTEPEQNEDGNGSEPSSGESTSQHVVPPGLLPYLVSTGDRG